MKNTRLRAERELEILAKTTPDAVVLEFKSEIIALCEAFGNSGQSGGSAPYTATALSQAIKKLLLFEIIAPLTGEDDEWNDVSDLFGGNSIFQNNRDSRVFKNGKDGKAHFIEAIVFDGDVGGRFTAQGSVSLNGENISSFQFIKSFPFTPKT